MRIVYLGAFRLPNYDAAAARVLGIATAIKALDNHSVDFISWGGHYRESDLCDDGCYRVIGCPYVITGEIDASGGYLRRIKSWLHRGKLTMQLLRERPTYDVIIAYNPDYYITRKLLSYCEKTGTKLVSDLTEWYSSNELPFIDRLPNWFNMTSLQKRVNNKICISSFLSRYYHHTHNIVIPATSNSADPKWNSQAPSFLKTSESCKTLIYAGTPARKDLLGSVVNVVSRLILEGQDIRFIIIGVTAEDYKKRYGTISDEALSSGRLLFLGRKSQDEIPSFYKAADFMVLLRENSRKSNAGFPTKVSESFMSGVPVIANSTSDLGNYIINGQTGFLLSDYCEEELYKVLKNKVLGLSYNDILKMKDKVNISRISFESIYYSKQIDCFLKDLNSWHRSHEIY